MHAAAPILREFGDNGRTLACYVEEHKAALGYLKPALFLLLDGKRDRLDKIIMDLIYPKSNHFAADSALLPHV